MKNRLVSVVLVGLLGLVGCQQPEIKGQPNANGLSEVANSGMDAVLVNPKIDFSQYRSIAIADMNFSRLKIVEPDDSSGRYKKMTLSEEDIAMLRGEYRRKLGEVLSQQGGYQIVDSVEPGSKTLIVRTDMVRLEPNAPRERDEIGPGSARDKTFTKGAGSMTLEAELVDVSTGKAVVVLLDEVSDVETWSNNNPVSNRAAILRAFTSWGYGVRRQLDAFSSSRQ